MAVYESIGLAIYPNAELIMAEVKAWCWGNRYWNCLVEDTVRVDLNGNVAGQMTKADADRARKMIEGRMKKSEVVVLGGWVLTSAQYFPVNGVLIIL